MDKNEVLSYNHYCCPLIPLQRPIVDKPAIDRHRAAMNKASRIAREKQNGIRHLLRNSQAVERVGLGERLPRTGHTMKSAMQQGRFDATGADGVDSDLRTAILVCCT